MAERQSDYTPPLFGFDERPQGIKAILFAFQHLLAMFSGNILCPIIVCNMLALPHSEKTFLLQAALFSAGVATLIQVRRIGPVGSGLPIVMGTSNAFIPTIAGIAGRYGIGAVLATGFLGGLFEGMLGAILPKIRKILTPLVSGVVVLTIGITLIPVGIRQAAGGSTNFGSIENLLLSGLVLTCIVVFSQFGPIVTRSAAIMISMVIGFVAAALAGLVDFTPVAEASWVSFPSPFQYTWSVPLDALIAMLLMYTVTSAETVGDVFAITALAENRAATIDESRGAVMADGVGSSIAAFFNAFPNTSYSQNIGVMAISGVMSRHVVQTSGIILLILALLPKISALIAIIPTAVLGGAAIVLFSTVASSGLLILRKVPLNRRNILIIAVSAGLGIGLNAVPESLNILPDGLRLIFAETGVATSTLVAILLDRILPEAEVR
ncbi:nucleobase:cation symporter-2 family protein [Pseudodesulfovibrio indicus]|uniref:uracil-xanthine permease family protein n=1 Tax=Pseudodesulfovibrio indicus TaxID=1716143 RepID=UPI00292E783A|nr:nucleobase:cation symporter-2 family protein [Pseudodesulfovibrio indicus]